MYFSCTDIVYDDRKLLDIRAYGTACVMLNAVVYV